MYFLQERYLGLSTKKQDTVLQEVGSETSDRDDDISFFCHLYVNFS